jgi:hypothetical protein
MTMISAFVFPIPSKILGLTLITNYTVCTLMSFSRLPRMKNYSVLFNY